MPGAARAQSLGRVGAQPSEQPAEQRGRAPRPQRLGRLDEAGHEHRAPVEHRHRFRRSTALGGEAAALEQAEDLGVGLGLGDRPGVAEHARDPTRPIGAIDAHHADIERRGRGHRNPIAVRQVLSEAVAVH